jgi:hypothetical protein
MSGVPTRRLTWSPHPTSVNSATSTVHGQRMKGETMRLKSGLIGALCAVGFAVVGAGGALAGEVKGPPSPCVNEVCTPNTNYNDAALTHANSVCVFSGLNDYVNGQKTKPTQTPADGPPGTPGTACLGGSNPDNQPAPGGPGTPFGG